MAKKVVNMMEGVEPKDAWLWAIRMYRIAVEDNMKAAWAEMDDLESEYGKERIDAALKAFGYFADEMERLVEGAM